MPDIVRDFYDHLAGSYHLMFEDWEASMARQATTLGAILERDLGPGRSQKILDCACGIGTQALGLADLGFQVSATDLSPRAIERARAEASARGLNVAFQVSDMRDLAQLRETGFDAVICMDNALPHIDTDEQIVQAASQVHDRLRPGGLFLVSIRDYDLLIAERPVVQGPAFYADAGRRRVVFQLWDWIDERRYTFHLYITYDTGDGWRTHHDASTYRAILRSELTNILERAGFRNMQWLMPAESGFYQPVVIARAARKP